MKFLKSMLALVLCGLLPQTTLATSSSSSIIVPEFNPRKHLGAHLGIFVALNLIQIAYNGMEKQPTPHRAQPQAKNQPLTTKLKQHGAHAFAVSKAFVKALVSWKNYQTYGRELKQAIVPTPTKGLKRSPAELTKAILASLKHFALTHKIVTFGLATQAVAGSAYAWHCNNEHTKAFDLKKKALQEEAKAKAEADKEAARLADIAALNGRASKVGLTAKDKESVANFEARITAAEAHKKTVRSK